MPAVSTTHTTRALATWGTCIAAVSIDVRRRYEVWDAQPPLNDPPPPGALLRGGAALGGVAGGKAGLIERGPRVIYVRE